MPLKLMYITNDPEIALIAVNNGVDRIWIDLETKGKEVRQKNLDTVKSAHSISDIQKMSRVLTKSELMVRINPWDAESYEEIEHVIDAGAKRIMLPMWKTEEEVDAFLKAVNGRVRTTLLLETKEAEVCLDAVLEHPLVEEIHIGLNDLHLSYGLTFMFELYANGVVERICRKCRAKGIPYGIGGIARLGNGLVPSEHIIMEHYRLGSTAAILSRTFCNVDEIQDTAAIRRMFKEEMEKIRAYEASLSFKSAAEFEKNRETANKYIRDAATVIRERRMSMQAR